MKKRVVIGIVISVLIILCGAIAYYYFHTHSYEASITKEKSCEMDGEMTYTCWCGSSYIEPIDATGHEYISAVVAEAECEVVGKIEYTCSLCGEVYHEEIPALEHEYEESVTDATCGIAGAKVYTCTLCGDNYSEEIPALEHEYEVTEDNENETIYTCKNCQDSYSEKKEKPVTSTLVSVHEETGALIYSNGNGMITIVNPNADDGTIPPSGIVVPDNIRFY